MKRRDLLKTAFLGAGAALTQGPPFVKPTPAQAAAASAAAQAASSEGWKPLLFDRHQNETVVTLTDLIIPATDTPGAKEARVNVYIDLILHDGDYEPRHAFLQGLGWLDGYAMRRHEQPFVKCTEAQQIALLESLDESWNPDLETGADFFAQLKQLTLEGYYTSKIGIEELNKGGVPGTFACEDGEHA